METVELATAYLSLVPSLEGSEGKIVEALGGAGDKAGVSFLSRFKKAAAVGTIVAGVVAGFAGLYQAGSIMDDVADTIRVGTGATGESLQELQDVARNVATAVPVDFATAGQTVADLNTRLGLTGETLTTVASQYAEAGRMLGETVDINTTSAAFSAFRIEGEQVSGALDELFQVSQATGVGMNELASLVQSNAPAVQALGFSFSETAALAGSLDKAGLNTTQVMSSLSRSLVNLAKDGEQPQEAFRRVVGELEGFIDAGDTAAAVDLAGKVFGTRGAAQFIGAIESGTLALDDLVGATGATQDTILGVAAETASFGESWRIVKNNALAAIEPISSGLFELASGGMAKLASIAQDLSPVISGMFDQLGPTLLPLIGQVAELWAQFSPLSIILQALEPVLPVLAGALGQVASAVGGALSAALSAVMSALEPVAKMLAGTLSDVLVELAPIVADLAGTLGDVLGSVLEALTPLLVLVAEVVGQVLQAVLPLIDPVLSLVEAFLPLLAPLVELVGVLLAPLIQLLTALLTPILALISPLADLLAGAIGVVIDVIAEVIGWVADGIAWFVRLVTGSEEAAAQFNAVWSAVGQWFANVWNGIVSGLSNAIGQIGEFIGGIWDTVMNALGDVGSWLVNAGGDLIRGFWNGIAGMGDWLWNQITGFFDGVVGWAKDILGIASPSKRFHDEVGEQVGEGVAGGIRDSFGVVRAAVDDLVDIPSSDVLVGVRTRTTAALTSPHVGDYSPAAKSDTFNFYGVTTATAAREIQQEITKTQRRGFHRANALAVEV